MTTRGTTRFTGTTLAQLVLELNRFAEALQNGGLNLNGLRLDPNREAAPTEVPGAGEPNVVLVDISGTRKLYVYDVATGWVVAGGQS